MRTVDRIRAKQLPLFYFYQPNKTCPRKQYIELQKAALRPEYFSPISCKIVQVFNSCKINFRLKGTARIPLLFEMM